MLLSFYETDRARATFDVYLVYLAEDARLHSAHLHLSFPCGQPLQSVQWCFRLPCGQGLQSTQLCFRLPCGQGLQSTQLRFSLPCGQGLQAAQLRFSLLCGQGLQSAQLLLTLLCGQGLQSAQACFRLPCAHRFRAPIARALDLAVASSLRARHVSSARHASDAGKSWSLGFLRRRQESSLKVGVCPIT